MRLCPVSLILGFGLEHFCPWSREVLPSERLFLASDFFGVLGLEPCVLDSTSENYSTFSFIKRCQSSFNNLINSLMTSGCFYESNFYVNYNNLLFAFALIFNCLLVNGHACWPLFMLILFFCECVCLLFTVDLASCCLCLPLVSRNNNNNNKDEKAFTSSFSLLTKMLEYA